METKISYGWREYGLQIISEDPTAVLPALQDPDTTVKWLREIKCFDRHPEQECVVVIALNRKHKMIGWQLVTVGLVSSTFIHPRETFRFAIMSGASAIVCAHNHPSGDPCPSSADIQVTRKLKEAGMVCDIELMDHIIVGSSQLDPVGLGFYSFRTAGLL